MSLWTCYLLNLSLCFFFCRECFYNYKHGWGHSGFKSQGLVASMWKSRIWILVCLLLTSPQCFCLHKNKGILKMSTHRKVYIVYCLYTDLCGGKENVNWIQPNVCYFLFSSRWKFKNVSYKKKRNYESSELCHSTDIYLINDCMQGSIYLDRATQDRLVRKKIL